MGQEAKNKMEREDHFQLELFSQAKNYTQGRPSNNLFFGYFWKHEKIIIMIMGGLFVGVVSFSLGVERGKKLAMLTMNNQMTAKYTPAAPASLKTAVPVKTKQLITAPLAEQQKQDTGEKALPRDSELNYTIQLASYQIKTTAQKEAQALQKKGFSPVVLSKGKYTVLCVGRFANQNKAKIMLTELKKRYKDCLIRRL